MKKLLNVLGWWRIKYFIRGVKNIIRWMPTIYKDRDWDHSYFYTILEKKLQHMVIRFQSINHMSLANEIQDIKLILRLLNRVQHDYYSMEYLEEPYYKGGEKFSDPPIYENYIEYIYKYRNDSKKAHKKANLPINNDSFSAVITSQYREEKARNLLFKLIAQKIPSWWD